jgi:hypothetical protein
MSDIRHRNNPNRVYRLSKSMHGTEIDSQKDMSFGPHDIWSVKSFKTGLSKSCDDQYGSQTIGSQAA